MQAAIQAQALSRDLQAQLGLVAAALASRSFLGVNVRTGAGAEEWAALLSQQVMDLREVSSRVAVATYQLARWLQTGYTLGETGAADGAALVRGWLALMLDVVGLPAANGALGEEIRAALRQNGGAAAFQELADRIAGFEKELASASGAVGVDPWNWDTLDRSQSARVQTLLREHALRKARKELAGGDLTPERIEELGALSSLAGSSLADAMVMQGGRAIPLNTALEDSRVIWYARGTSLNPCAFCAMLASRGPVYKTSGSMTYAQLTDTIRAYHDNCHCFPIFSFSDDTELPEQNKFFEKHWKEVTEDYPSEGNGKLNAWRRWLNANKARNGGTLNINETPGG